MQNRLSHCNNLRWIGDPSEKPNGIEQGGKESRRPGHAAARCLQQANTAAGAGRRFGGDGRRGPRRRRSVHRARLFHPGGDRAQPRGHQPGKPEHPGGPAQQHHLSPGEDHGVAGVCAPAQGQALPGGPPAVRAGRQCARRCRDGQPRHAHPRGLVAGNRGSQSFRRQNGGCRRGDRPHRRGWRIPVDRAAWAS